MSTDPQTVTLAQALQLAMQRLKTGQVDEAETICRQVLKADSRNAMALQLLGVAALGRKEFEPAVAFLQQSLDQRPEQPQAWNSLGAALQKLDRFEEATAAYCRALELKPDYPGALNNLAVLLSARDQLDEAERCYARALAVRPDDPELHNNRGNLLKRFGRYDEAIACYQRALELKPEFPEAHVNYGMALQAKGRLADAMESFRRGAELRPDFAEAHCNLGHLLWVTQRLEESVAAYRRALEHRPDYPEASGAMLHQMQRMCDWSELEALSAQQLDLVRNHPDATVAPFSVLCIASSAEDQLAAARNWCHKCVEPVVGLRERLGLRHERGPRARLRLGYVSGDFREHPVGRLSVGVLEGHDRKRFEVIGYSHGPDDGSALRRRMAAACDRFVDVGGLAHEAAATRIYQDRPDILIDLTGYTQHCRTELFALQPAPVQVAYLGQSGTMGAQFIDYVLTDHYVTPPRLQPLYVEKPVYLPAQLSAQPPGASDSLVSRAQASLPDDAFVFCCFAQALKISPEIFSVWMRILQAAPKSVLWLSRYNRWVPDNLRREAAARGVDPARLVFAPLVPHAEYTALLPLADLFLDTLPFNAHTTASDALCAGVPVLTCTGEAPPARLAGSLLVAAGLPELITASLADYEALAVRLASDPQAHRALRDKLLRNRASAPLYDRARFMRALEDAYRAMWQRYERGEPPAPIDVSAGS